MRRPYFFALSCGLGGFIWYTVMSYYVASTPCLQTQDVIRGSFRLAVVLVGFALYTFAGIFLNY
jgi:hypothetical protein